MHKILIIEDDSGIAEAVREHLENWGFEARCINDFHSVMDEYAKFMPSIVLLDISLPYFDGYHWCSEIRKFSNVPIIFISSAADNMNIVMAMNMGADDFIAKPFELSVLTAKINALVRRTYDYTTDAPFLECRGAFLNTGDSSLSYNGEKIELTKNEYKILICLLENKGKVVSREKLMEKLWETYEFIDENTLTVNINRLRKKLEHNGLKDFITTKFGIGYIVEQDDNK